MIESSNSGVPLAETVALRCGSTAVICSEVENGEPVQQSIVFIVGGFTTDGDPQTSEPESAIVLQPGESQSFDVRLTGDPARLREE